VFTYTEADLFGAKDWNYEGVFSVMLYNECCHDRLKDVE